MNIDRLSPYVTFCSADECDVDVPNEFITIHFRKLPGGRLSSHFERWSSDSLSCPSRRSQQKARELADATFSKKLAGAAS